MIIEPPFIGVVESPAFSVGAAAGTPPQAARSVIIRMSHKLNRVFLFIKILLYVKDKIK